MSRPFVTAVGAFALGAALARPEAAAAQGVALPAITATAPGEASPSAGLPAANLLSAGPTAISGPSVPGLDPSLGPPTGGSLTVPSVQDQRRQVLSTVGSVAFIDATSFANRYTNNLPDVLRETPGVFAQTRYGQEVRLSVRGSGLGRAFHLRGVELLQDGIPFNFADGSGDFYQVDPLSLRSIEVYKGGNALIFGSSTLGGAINFVSPTAFTAFAPNIVRIEGGSFGAIRTNVQVSRISGDADALINATYSHQDGFRRHQNQDYGQFNGNIGYRLAPGIETRTYLGYYVTRQKLPGTLDLLNALTFPRQAAAAASLGNQKRDVEAERIANRTSFALDVGQLDIDTWLIHKRLFHPIFQVIDQDGLTYGVAPHWTGSFDLGGFRNDLTVGARAVAGENKALQFVNVGGRRGTPTANARQSARNYEGYVDNRFWVTPELALMAGAKVFRSERDFRNVFSVPNREAERDYDGVNPKLGLLYQPLSNIQVFADLTRSRDVPDFSDLGQSNLSGLTFVPLQAQKAWTAEIGTRGSWDRLRWDLTYYRSTIRDELLTFNTSAALGIPASTFNADRTVHQGIEFAATIDLLRDVSGPEAGDRVAISQVWTYNDFRFVRDRVYGSNRIGGVPEHVLRTIVAYTHPSGFYLSPAVDWVPVGPFADHANTLRVPGYALLGLQTGMSFGNGLSVYLDARNLTDRRYVSDLGPVTNARLAPTTIFYPGEGRSVFAGLRFTW